MSYTYITKKDGSFNYVELQRHQDAVVHDIETTSEVDDHLAHAAACMLESIDWLVPRATVRARLARESGV